MKASAVYILLFIFVYIIFFTNNKKKIMDKIISIKNRKQKIQEERDAEFKKELKIKERKIMDYLNGKKIQNETYYREYWNNKWYPHTKLSELFKQSVDLVEYLQENYRHKARIESINNYVLEVFEQLILLDPELCSENLELVKDEVEEMLMTYKELLEEMKEETDKINNEIRETNKKIKKERFGKHIKTMTETLESMREDVFD